MIANAQDVLEKFGQLPPTEKKKVVSAILRESLDIETAELTDEELINNAEEIFLKMDRDKFDELLKQKSLKSLWEFYQKLRLISRKINTQEFKAAFQNLNVELDEWLKKTKESSNEIDYLYSNKSFEHDLWLSLYLFVNAEFEKVVGDMDAEAVWDSRVSEYSVIHAFKQGASPEEIVLRFPSLDLINVYSLINSHLQNPTKFERRFAEELKQQNKQKRQVEKRFSPEGIRQRLLERSQNKK